MLAIRQARQLLPDMPIVAGSAMHQPATAALLEPAELKGVCAETAASPVSAHDAGRCAPSSTPTAPPTRATPTPIAAAQYDAVRMLAKVIGDAAPAKAAR